MGRPLKIAKATLLNVTNTTATTNIVTVSQTLANLGIVAGMAFVPTTTTGTNLVAGTTYWILEITGASTFTVSATQPSANPNSTPVTLTTGTTASILSVNIVDSGFSNPDGSNTATNSTSYGAVGGNTSIYGKQALVRVAISVDGVGTITVADDSPNIDGVGTDFANTFVDGTVVALADGTVLGTIDDIANANATFATFAANATANATDASYVYATNEAGFIVRQKGKTKYLVQGATSSLVGACYTANVANAALAPGQMNILATYADSSTKYVDSLNDYQSEVFPTQVAAGSLSGGTQYTIYSSGDTDWTAVGAATNMTGVTFTATGAGSGTGTAIAVNANPDVIATFGTAYAANTYGGQPNPIVVISNA